MPINRSRKIVGDVQDRGNLKWTALMLPEHIRMLREWYEEDHRIPRPDLDEFDLRQIQEELDVGLKRNCEMKIETWHDEQVTEHRGRIERIDLSARNLFYENSSGRQRLSLDEIIAASSLE